MDGCERRATQPARTIDALFGTTRHSARAPEAGSSRSMLTQRRSRQRIRIPCLVLLASFALLACDAGRCVSVELAQHAPDTA